MLLQTFLSSIILRVPEWRSRVSLACTSVAIVHCESLGLWSLMRVASCCPRASERRVLPIVGVWETFSPVFMFMSSRLHGFVFKASHLHIFASSHLLLIFSCHLHIVASSHLNIFSSSHLLILRSSPHFLILTSSLGLVLSCLLAFGFFSKSRLKVGTGAVLTRWHGREPFRMK